jgi:4-oxalocrotonate tautomerase
MSRSGVLCRDSYNPRVPLVEITLRKGKTPEFLRDAANAIHDALVAQANVPADDRFQIIHEVAPDALIAHPSYAGVSRSADLIIVRITLNAGRTLDIKKNLYAEIVRRLGRAVDARPDDVLICLVEVAKENWSFGKGGATYS